MMSFFEGMKASLDLATSASILVAVALYIQDNRKSKAKEREELEKKAISKSLDRFRSSFDSLKSTLVEKGLALDVLSRSDNERENISQEVRAIQGEVVFRVRLLEDQIKREGEFFVSSIQDEKRRFEIKEYIEGREFGLSLALKICLLAIDRYIDFIIQGLEKDNNELLKQASSICISSMCVSSPTSFKTLESNFQGLNVDLKGLDLATVENVLYGKDAEKEIDLSIVGILEKFFSDLSKKLTGSNEKPVKM